MYGPAIKPLLALVTGIHVNTNHVSAKYINHNMVIINFLYSSMHPLLEDNLYQLEQNGLGQ
jgi:hypothetical protein